MVAIFQKTRFRWLLALILMLLLFPMSILLNRQFLRANHHMDLVLDEYGNVAVHWNVIRVTLSGRANADEADPADMIDRLHKLKTWLAAPEMDRISQFTLLEGPRGQLFSDIEIIISEITNPAGADVDLLIRIDSNFLIIRDILRDYRGQLEGYFSFLVQAQVVLILLLTVLVAVALEDHGRQQMKLETSRRNQMEISRVQEGERNRIALDLHDDIAQELSWMRLKLADLTAEPAFLNVMDNLVSRIRDMSQNLRAPDFAVENFDNALKDIISINERRSGMSILYIPGKISPQEYPELYGHIYRVLQECLSNSRKYAGKCRVFIEIQEEGGEVFCDYRDEGPGFDMRDGKWKESLGFRGIWSRMALIGGKVVIEGHPGIGMILRFHAPLARFAHGK